MTAGQNVRALLCWCSINSIIIIIIIRCRSIITGSIVVISSINIIMIIISVGIIIAGTRRPNRLRLCLQRERKGFNLLASMLIYVSLSDG